jgi:hypothetical protein
MRSSPPAMFQWVYYNQISKQLQKTQTKQKSWGMKLNEELNELIFNKTNKLNFTFLRLRVNFSVIQKSWTEFFSKCFKTFNMK